MKKISILLSFFLTSYMFSFGQVVKIKQADKLYENYSYSKSIKKYEQISNKTIKILRHLAESYYHIEEYEKSEEYYAQVVKSNERTANDLYNYSYILSMNKKYKESSKWISEYNKLQPTDKRGILATNKHNFFVDLQKDKGKFVITNLGMNTNDDDFGVAYYKNKVVFCSSRTSIKLIKRKWNWNNLPFLDLYIADVDSSNKEFKEIKPFNNKFNSKYHEGKVAFNKTGDFLILTRNTGQKSSDGIIKIQMFYSNFLKGKWGKLKPMPFNSKEYSVAQPSLSENGDTLYFVSDMNGGFGGIDIYKSVRISDKWSKPINLGEKINTEGNETFPFIHKDGYLFFSSDGLPGLGGLDVFVARLNGNEIGNVENLSVPVNSSKDDFAFILNDKMETGYFSSNRETGKGNDDIYKFTLLKPISTEKLIKGIAKDIDNNILAEVEVNFYNNDKIIKTVSTKEDGSYEFIAEADKLYKLEGKKANYLSIENEVDTHADSYVFVSDLILEPIPKHTLYCTVTDEKTGNSVDGVNVIMTNNFSNEIEQFTTSASGKFLKMLNNKLNDSISYTINLQKDGYVSKRIEYKNILTKEGKYVIIEQITPIGDDIVVVNTVNLIEINPIYFDFNDSKIRKDAKVELDKIVTIMNDNPNIKIELSSHTDSRGSSVFNESLSQKRAISSSNYIKQKISNSNRIEGKGYGESQFLIVSQKIHDKYPYLSVGQVLDNTFINSLTKSQQEIAHQLNRRTEFKIVE